MYKVLVTGQMFSKSRNVSRLATIARGPSVRCMSGNSFAMVSRPALRSAFAIQAPTVGRPHIRFYSDATKESNTESAQETQGAQAELTEHEKEIAELKAKLDKKDKEAAQLKDKYTRAVADFRNLQETTKREIQKARDFALQKFAKDLLESVDNFDRALSVVSEESRTDAENQKELVNLYDGIKMTQDIFERTLASHGLKKLHPLGEKFDPNVHEATFEVPQPDKEPGTVFHVQQTGFTYNDRVLRAPKVGVVKGDS